ncbi:2-amino-4-hydroxy-6-hydroxymethyldihydropteridine diphosphokinase [Agarivorans sp. TSD2052]|uniref:2-amino-4-hydroxy-6- hydroxymethyldihydropteridine diphosphokinase n=1 Tax=Agarivorans sp. TSD2052 TaxID=2937286 RepID=UPI0020107606|nr:2-amino-4-hydroxy-6-hydroxymethyldihydropteridine diphosphokinase [Agarivorans sp. TSD2052]UPW19375.1 2-amino-4-hydroxy-6-hydroxymethyldihydropteridine diphosphokinase [Agarivorans sp. TSD2052]
MADIFVGIGSNIERERYIRQGVEALEARFGRLTLSPVYESPALGFDGPAFYNLVAKFSSPLSLQAVFDAIKGIEFEHGRAMDAQKYSSRTLDIDILLYNHLVVDIPCTLPRAEITKSAFVLKPLADIAGSMIHPTINKSYMQLWQDFDHPSQVLTLVDSLDF